MTFEEERELLKRLNPYQDMHRALAWGYGFTFALRHPMAEQVLDADVASSEAHQGFARCREWQAKTIRTDEAGRDVTPTIGDRVMNHADYADTIEHLDNYAEGLELEATFGNPADTERLGRAAKLLRRAIIQLQPLAQADEITAADPE
jgi:hypothetical protein